MQENGENEKKLMESVQLKSEIDQLLMRNKAISATLDTTRKKLVTASEEIKSLRSQLEALEGVHQIS